MEAGPRSIGLYIHIPFCQAKCTYCDFNSFAGQEHLFDSYTVGLVREMELADPGPVATIYIGGGTPTVLPLSLLAQAMHGIRHNFDLQAGAEISLEANPGTVGPDVLNGLRALGVNRLSLGIQSFDNGELQRLGRIHTSAQAVQAFHSARLAGFDNINLDLIYGQPGQSLSSWAESLRRALDLQPDHLSLYALTLEDGTPLATAVAKGEVPDPDPDLAADMVEFAQESLSPAGFVHYEISNWARSPQTMCQHNLTYWRNEAYLGIGAGAHSWRNGRRWSNIAQPAEYATRVLCHRQPVASEEIISPELEMGETMIMGLRLLDEGVNFERFRQRFGLDLTSVFSHELEQLVELGLIQENGDRVRLSERGWLLGNQVFLRFLPD
jgi:oxygen-independent coproporphyrinogen-3 oxidase